jgi:hypothetical protein
VGRLVVTLYSLKMILIDFAMAPSFYLQNIIAVTVPSHGLLADVAAQRGSFFITSDVMRGSFHSEHSKLNTNNIERTIFSL